MNSAATSTSRTSARSSASIAPQRVWTARRCAVNGPATRWSSGQRASTPPAPMPPPCCNSSANTGRSRTACTTCGTAPSTKTAPRSDGVLRPRSWRPCATWPSASCARREQRTSPAPRAGARGRNRWCSGSSVCARRRSTARTGLLAPHRLPARWTAASASPPPSFLRPRDHPPDRSRTRRNPTCHPLRASAPLRLCAKSGPACDRPCNRCAGRATSAMPWRQSSSPCRRPPECGRR